MASISLREASRRFAVSRATLNKHLANGKVSGVQDAAGHWQIDTAELIRVYKPRETVGRTKPDQVSRDDPPLDRQHNPTLAPADPDLAVRLARAEAALEAEREKTSMLQRHLDDVRRMLPPPESAGDPALRKKPRGWWPF